MEHKIGVLYLIPNKISEAPLCEVIPERLKLIVPNIKHYIVEDTRNARRYLKLLNKEVDINTTCFYELNKHTPETDISTYLSDCEKGFDIGLISEAGLPCVADPGNIIVQLAHQKNIRVIPLVGPSSIFLALMASGLNGQNFAFNGYLPIDQNEKFRKLRELEARSNKEHQSQIFMDTPYRNNKLLEDVKNTLQAKTKLCIALNVTAEDEFICTKTIGEWKNINIDLNKKPCIFII